VPTLHAVVKVSFTVFTQKENKFALFHGFITKKKLQNPAVNASIERRILGVRY
jgi:hypothetical protein